MRFGVFITLLLTMLFCTSCYNDPSQDLFIEVNMPPKPDSLDQRSPVIVLFASDFPVYPEPYTYLGTIRMNQKWHRCEVEPLAFLQGKARRVGANVVYIKHSKDLYDAKQNVPLCNNLLADFLNVDESLVRQYYGKPDAFDEIESGVSKW